MSDPAPSTSSLDTPLPLTLPAILRNPNPPPAAHLHQPQRAHGGHHSAAGRASGKPARVEGRRARLRRENDALAFNPHARPPTRSELPTLFLPTPPRPTFPSPLPAHLLPRTRPAPSPPAPVRDQRSADAGRYGTSLTGVRRQLRAKGARAEDVVRIVEGELERWLASVRAQAQAAVVLRPDDARSSLHSAERRVVDPFLVTGHDGVKREAIVEVQRGEGSLVWEVGASFERFVVHCVARHHELVSFSKETPSGIRRTHILVPPSLTARRRPAPAAESALDTPPTTDLSSLNGSGTDTDAAPADGGGGGRWGAWDSESEAEGPVPLAAAAARGLAGRLHALDLNSVDAAALEHHHLSAEGDDTTSDDESVSSLAPSLAEGAGAGAQHRLLPHGRPAFVPTPIGGGDSEDEDADRTFTLPSPPSPAPAAGTPRAAGAAGGGTGASGRPSFWAFVYA